MLERDAFVGESCLAGQPVHSATATAVEDSTLVRLGKDAMIRGLHEEPVFAEQFWPICWLTRYAFQEALVDHIINSSEKRLARVLLSLAHSKDKGKPEAVLPKLSHETFAAMVGTTRSRVSFFMNRFRNLGYIDYHGHTARCVCAAPSSMSSSTTAAHRIGESLPREPRHAACQIICSPVSNSDQTTHCIFKQTVFLSKL